jgi:predicted acylesterase/phospholipase RssA/CRP-like cAMP-binding protein
MLDDILELRSQCILLTELDGKSLRNLVSSLEEVRVPAGADLVREGEKADRVYIVLEGRLEVLARSGGAGDLVINELGRGDTLGEVTMFCGGARTATVRALEESRVAGLDIATFNRLLEEHPGTSRRLSEEATARLRRSQLVSRVEGIFGSLDAEVLHDIEKEVEWLTLKGGETLFEQGDAAESAFIVIDGRLRVVSEDSSPARRVLDEVGPGETVGEIALLTEGARAASVYAVRDSEVVRFSRAAFERLVEKYPSVMMHISRLLGSRLLKMKSPAQKGSDVLTTFALIPVDGDLLLEDLVRQLTEAMSKQGPTFLAASRKVDGLLCREGIAQVGQGQPSSLRLEQWLNEREAEHQFVVYQADPHWSGWTERCLRQADHILFFARAGSPPKITELEAQIRERVHPRHPPRRSLVLLHPRGESELVGTSAWLADRDVDDHYHVRLDHPSDVGRLARILTGTAVGLVLGGGGARGLAHIGAIRAIEELGIPIDFAGGTSQGAMIASGCGLDYRSAEIHTRIKRLIDSFFDFTFPMVSLLAGFRIRTKMIAGYGDAKIEDLPVTFYCVSTNLTRAEQVVHRSGTLWEAVRSSMSLPGLLPPVCRNGDLLVDGGILNNVPADIMRSLCGKGKVIAVDVAPTVDLEAPAHFASELSGWKLLRQRFSPFSRAVKPPTIANVLHRSVFVPSVNSRNSLQESELADIYLQLPVGKWSMMDFKCMDEIVEAGYQSSLEQLKNFWD